jgi:hypothetical protein
MSRRVRSRFWLELGLASLTGVLFLVTLVSREWIEAVTGWDPDHHSGSLEWGIVLGLLALTALAAGTAYAEWRRSLPAPT